MLATRVFTRGLLRSSRHTNQFFTSSTRRITTETIPSSSYSQILASQRLARPVSPHLTIYQPQLTWYMSMSHRLAGVLMSGPLYLFAIGYTLSPVFGWDLSGNNLVKKWSEFGTATKTALKAPIAFIFSFKCWNGMRHLVWDTAKELSVRGVYRTGYGVLALSAVSTVGLLMA